ncbi:MAG: glycogen debranching enzyme family protein [Nitrospira sp.]|nr:glycogen debranching enzyme family protein [Nitrospira sp.]
MKIGKKDCQNLGRALSLEWLETNGRGGFASGTVSGANTRRYHALLLTVQQPRTNRYVLVNHIEEWLSVDGEQVPLSTNLYPDTVHPQGYLHCTSFVSTPWPTWIYSYKRKKIQREILRIWGRDIVFVRWKLIDPKNNDVTLTVRPMLTGRDYHALHHENERIFTQATINKRLVIWQPYEGLPVMRAFHSGSYRHAPDWFRHVQFTLEQERGLDFGEDWWSPGEFVYTLQPGEEQTLAFTSETVDRLDSADLVHKERARRIRLQKAAPDVDRLSDALWQAADSFLVQRGTQHTVIAGYPWFTDWGRDTFISLPGLCLVTGRHEMAWQIIQTFSCSVSEGMVPNRFPDQGEDPEYNSIDASLWFVHAVDRYLTYSEDATRVRLIAWPTIKQILDGYRQGTRYNIHMDVDGLIIGGTPGTQLTWMDVKIGDWVVTPRYGKPVEIQALWLRALEIGARLAAQFSERDYAEDCRKDRVRGVESFREKFWYKDGRYLYDTIDGPEGGDTSLRPNQIFAIALCDDLLTKEEATQVLHIVKEHLLTPVGLRTLSPTDVRYRPRYEGCPMERDSAYHQGTVWPFLLGPFVTAWLKIFGHTDKTRTEARSFLNGIDAHLQQACLGQVSEIFDGDPPHHPRGCPAQAWSVAEPLRALAEDLGISISTGVVRATRSK